MLPDADPHTEVPGGHLHFLEAIGPDHGTTAERVIPLFQLLAFLRVPSGLKAQGVSLQEYRQGNHQEDGPPV